MGISLWDLFLRPFGVHFLCLSLGKPYGGLRLLVEFHFCVDSGLGGKFLLAITLLREGLCNGELVLYVSMQRGDCGPPFDTLQCRFWCNGEIVDHHLIHCSVAFDLWCYVIRTFGIWCVWRRFLIYYVDGGLGDLIVCQLFGTLFPFVCYGLSGGKEIDTLLKMWSARQLNC